MIEPVYFVPEELLRKTLSELDLLYRGSKPRNKNELKRLFNGRIRTIISLQEGWSQALNPFVYKDEKTDFEQMGGNFISIPFSNFPWIPPTYDQLEFVVKVVIDGLQRGSVLVHCLAGVDRTGMFCGYWKHTVCGYSVEDSWNYICETGMHWHYKKLWKKEFVKICEEYHANKIGR